MKERKLLLLKGIYILPVIIFILYSHETYAIKDLSFSKVYEVSNNNILKSHNLNKDYFRDEVYIGTQENDIDRDSIQEYILLVKTYSDSMQADKAIYYAKKYIRSTSDLSIINDHVFSKISQTDLYLNFKNSYKLRFNFLSLFYLFAGFLGLFIFIILNLKKKISSGSSFLMSLFVLLHSLFIIHLSLYLINCHYYFPHTLLMSTIFTFLYGPLIYFYFKITVTNYKLKWKNCLHLLPALILLVYIFPYYMMSAKEKFIILFDQEDLLRLETKFIIVAKIMSLVFYAVLTLKIYKVSKTIVKQKKMKLLWQRNIIAIYMLYVLAFILFITITLGFFDTLAFFHLQIIVMVGLVFYVAYIAYVQPEVFKGEVKLVDPINLFKYKTSNLTPSYSLELKAIMLKLLNDDKIHRENDINLQKLSEKLGTSRHNTSQVINEHFKLNFFELINKYRIIDAVEILNKNPHNNLNIIEVAYKVGFNNKVTFNKSFKKHLSQTPSEYIKSLDIKGNE
ncbi:MAG: helix-turn-helix transcriptional regulator [Flavobacteriaceae bacterium]|nr:helix-turn-helix transcriptional regulator [Flavobacteriaceae bacterium]